MESYFGPDFGLAEEARQDKVEEAAMLAAEIEAARAEVLLAVVEGVNWDE